MSDCHTGRPVARSRRSLADPCLIPYHVARLFSELYQLPTKIARHIRGASVWNSRWQAGVRKAVGANNADEPIHPDTRRGRFIVPSADLSASVAILLSGLFSKCALSRPAPMYRPVS